MDARSEVVRRALDYPYEVPAESFVLAGERVLAGDAIPVDLSERIPLLAYGSNAAPAVLARKLAAAPAPVPVLRAVVHGLDVVYSAHISRYGAVPATLRGSPGTEAPAFVAHLTAAQLDLITLTEPNYELGTLRSGCCELEGGAAPARLRAFLSRHGCLLLDDSPVALAAVEARGRTLPAMNQRQVLERVRDLLSPGRDLERFVLDCVEAIA